MSISFEASFGYKQLWNGILRNGEGFISQFYCKPFFRNAIFLKASKQYFIVGINLHSEKSFSLVGNLTKLSSSDRNIDKKLLTFLTLDSSTSRGNNAVDVVSRSLHASSSILKSSRNCLQSHDSRAFLGKALCDSSLWLNMTKVDD